MTISAAALALTGLLLFPGGILTDGDEILQSLPEGVSGWTSSGGDAVYNRETLYDYMDGGAEVYLAFDFRRVYARKYRNSAGEEISLDVYDMGDPAEAFGIFSCDREDPEAGIGQGSEFGYGLLRFWRGRFFVSVLAATEDPAAEKAVLELGKAAAAVLGPDGSPPDMVALLPDSGLRRERVSYFHSDVNLNNRYFIASENILRLDRRTECVFAEYGPSESPPIHLLIVRYPDEAEAEAAIELFQKSYLPETSGGGPCRMEDGTWALARRRETHIIVILDAPEDRIARDLFAEIRFER